MTNISCVLLWGLLHTPLKHIFETWTRHNSKQMNNPYKDTNYLTFVWNSGASRLIRIWKKNCTHGTIPPAYVSRKENPRKRTFMTREHMLPVNLEEHASSEQHPRTTAWNNPVPFLIRSTNRTILIVLSLACNAIYINSYFFPFLTKFQGHISARTL